MWLPVSIVSDCLACVCIVYQIVSDCLAWWTIKLATIAFLQQLIYNLHRSTLFASDFQRNLSAGRWLVGDQHWGKFWKRSSMHWMKLRSDKTSSLWKLYNKEFSEMVFIWHKWPHKWKWTCALWLPFHPRTLNYGWIGWWYRIGWYILVQDGTGWYRIGWYRVVQVGTG